jgi:hypothetical protein
MLEDQSGSTPQENIEQDVQTDTPGGDQNIDTLNQEKAYSQKQRKRAQSAESENEKLKARMKKIEEDALAEQGKFKEMWERDKDDAEWARGYRTDRKASLLEKIPEEKREKIKNMDLRLDALEVIAEQYTEATPAKETMKAVPGQVDTPNMSKPYKDMTEQERKKWHTQVIDSKN